MTQISPELFDKTWIHSHEEDAGNIQVYRLNTYKFPLSRGRKGFEIKKDGQFINHGIGPTDTSIKVNGNWTSAEPNTLQINFKDENKSRSYKLKILSYNNDILKVEKIDK